MSTRIGDLASGTLSIQALDAARERPVRPKLNTMSRESMPNGMGGVESDPALAATWYQRAADQNYSPAIQELGYLYEQGLGVKKDPMLALNLQRQGRRSGGRTGLRMEDHRGRGGRCPASCRLSEQLDASNSELQTLRSQLADTTKLPPSRRVAQLAKSESAALDLREQLAAAKQGQGDGSKLAELRNAIDRQGK